MVSRALLVATTAALLPAVTAGAASGAKPAHSCHGARATIVGTRGADGITGTRRRDVIVGQGGNDAISGVRGNDVICGGDWLSGDNGRDLCVGGSPRHDLSPHDTGDLARRSCEVVRSAFQS
jgi:Ca2+-binding RTX toxin-like protein